MFQSHLEGLVKHSLFLPHPQYLIQWIRGGPGNVHFYHSQVMMILQVQGPRFEDSCPGQPVSLDYLEANE